MFKKKTLRNKVIAIIEKTIDEEQKKYELEDEKLDFEFQEKVKSLGEKLTTDKDTLIEAFTKKILGKFTQ